MIPNHYKTLGIEISATKTEIKQAYKRLAFKYHPDVNKMPDAHERFIEINEAYLILSDDEARARYDWEYKRVYETKIPVAEDTEDKQSAAPSGKNPTYEYDDLNQWTQNARQQAESYAKMAFEDFSKLLIGVVKETGFQLGNAALVMIAALLILGGCSNVVIGISSGGETGNAIAGLIMLGIGLLLYNFSIKNYDKHIV